MSAVGPKRTRWSASAAAAFGSKADIANLECHVRPNPKRTRDRIGNNAWFAAKHLRSLGPRVEFQSRSLFGPRCNCGGTLLNRPLILAAGANGVAVDLALLPSRAEARCVKLPSS